MIVGAHVSSLPLCQTVRPFIKCSKDQQRLSYLSYYQFVRTLWQSGGGMETPNLSN